MGFWTVYFGLLAAMATMEAAHIGINYYWQWRQSKKAQAAQKEAQAKLASSLGISPEEIEKKVEEINSAREQQETKIAAQLFASAGASEAAPGSMEIPTASGEVIDEKKEADRNDRFIYEVLTGLETAIHALHIRERRKSHGYK